MPKNGILNKLPDTLIVSNNDNTKNCQHTHVQISTNAFYSGWECIRCHKRGMITTIARPTKTDK